ncbi:MAG: hypothetical protein WAT19_02895 [Ferruginibacter sp.]
MNKIYILTLVISLLSSCKETYKNVDPGKFNEIIKEKTDIPNAGELIKLYYRRSEINPINHSISVKKNRNNVFLITLINQALEDDSLSAEKIEITAEKKDQYWKVIEIRESWKCWPGRGHTGWGAEPCD